MNRARYTLVGLVPIAALLDSTALVRVPLRGHAVAAFAAGVLTFAAAFALARIGARSGHLPGFGLKRLSWPTLHPGLCAVAAGGAWAGFDGPFMNAPWSPALLAALAGGTVALVAAFAAVLPEANVAGDPRWCRTPDLPVGGPTYPLDYIDTGGLAITSRERGCSGTPTWQLLVKGSLEPDHVRTALADIAARYPILSMRVQALDGVPPWTTRYRYAHAPRFRVADIFRVADLRGHPDALAALVREERSRHLDLFTEFPVTLTLALLDGDRCRLIFRQHHAIADGRAFMALLADFGTFLQAAREGRRPAPDALAPVGRRTEAEALGLSGARLRREILAGFAVLVRIHARATLLPLKPLIQNLGDDYSGENATVHWVLPDNVLEGWNAARKTAGVSLNSLLTGAWFVALRRWHAAQSVPVGRVSSLVLQETRPREGDFVSFANHLAFPEVELRLDRVAELATAAQAVQTQMGREKTERTAIRRLLAERWLIRLVPLAILNQIALESKRPLQSTSFSNLISLTFPVIDGAGWKVEEVLITTPVQPHTGISLTVIRYNGQVVFNFNYKTSVVSREAVRALAEQFAGVLAESTGAQVSGRWC